MTELASLWQGFAVAFTPFNLTLMLVGMFGTAIFYIKGENKDAIAKAREAEREKARLRLEEEAKKNPNGRPLPEFGSDKDFQLVFSRISFFVNAGIRFVAGCTGRPRTSPPTCGTTPGRSSRPSTSAPRPRAGCCSPRRRSVTRRARC